MADPNPSRGDAARAAGGERVPPRRSPVEGARRPDRRCWRG
jgi:hypothetical protein